MAGHPCSPQHRHGFQHAGCDGVIPTSPRTAFEASAEASTSMSGTLVDWHNGGSSSSSNARMAGPTSGSRRTLLLSAAWPLVLCSVIGSEDPTTLLNSVLGGYFLPRLPSSQSFRLLDEIENAYTLE